MNYEMSQETKNASLLLLAQTVGMQNLIIDYALKGGVTQEIYESTYDIMTGYALFLEMVCTPIELSNENILTLKKISSTLAGTTGKVIDFLVEEVSKEKSIIDRHELFYMVINITNIINFFIPFDDWYDNIAIPIMKGNLAIPPGTDSIVQ